MNTLERHYRTLIDVISLISSALKFGPQFNNFAHDLQR